ncbi:HNH endonuclease signature motif containing protein [Paraburkholderia caballeronis]|uniref:HNH endonuclease n=1 Tax=Paraburkholderia caballeronis TaxID=416943 RepID=A0A1H7KZ52_9BURK|nr:HNH endonuclease signature motif containing protein [Paraburkholderia caballeronis]PXW28220.1 HNH endonuclease [Paraburkholderia caballeronis]PXX03586.1 HNH endonuclease [Paraburkholderia caballeronis]RAK04330.1 HNH endonuclease [Paraburkholderia caballeronis]SED84537.1 HNH endonuclease [Paraburkholderia caballeronis]SEK91830.1 HNH endonuclease [Paraburkholderia caballeronis]
MATIDSLMRRTVEAGECLEFTGHICKAGYGLVWHEGKNRLAHRVSFELHNAPITEKQDVMHSCDNRKCINPAHLSLGSRSENLRDMLAKGRGRHCFGEAHPFSKLTSDAVAQIRREFQPYSRTHGAAALARRFGVTQGAVSCVLRGKSWKQA